MTKPNGSKDDMTTQMTSECHQGLDDIGVDIPEVTAEKNGILG